MEFREKLTALRRAKGLSQEELGHTVGVSRQTVSKWETGQSTPELSKLIELGRAFEISLDELVGNAPQEIESEKTVSVPVFVKPHYEYKSKRTLFGLPLVHINLGRGLCRAKGILAIGNLATGVFSVGILSVGLFSLGALALGALAFGGIAAGLLCAGGISVGLFAVGGVAVGGIALGGVAVGSYAAGGCAVGDKVALGDWASGHIAAGRRVYGVQTLTTDSTSGFPHPKMLGEMITEAFPRTPKWIVELFNALARLPIGNR